MLLKLRLIVGCALVACTLQANAGIVTVNGDNVRFTYDDSTLFGTGNVIGDNIFFLPTEFIAESLNGAGLVETSDTLSVQVEVITAGYWLADFKLAEQGDYQLTGAGATADVGGYFAVESNTSGYSDMNSISAGPLTVQGSLTEWSLDSAIMLSDTAGWGSDTDVNVDLYNISSASTDALGEEAYVEKKIGGVGVMISAVPVPAAVWLFGSGLLAVAGWSRRKVAG